MVTFIIEVTQFDSKASDLRGCLEADMASVPLEVHNMAVRGNTHMDTKAIKVADFKSEVKFDL